MTTIFVTGGSKGIGRAISLHLCSLGHNVAFSYNKSKNLAESLLEEAKSLEGKIFAVPMQVESKESIHQAFNAAKKNFNSNITCLINNAAIAQEKPFLEITSDDWKKMHDVNLLGPFICAQEVIPEMIKSKWGRIINISSIGGQWGGFNQAHYASSKAGLINLTKTIAKIYSSDGILSNALAIGLVDTDMSAAEINRQDGKEKINGIPIGRIANMEEITSVVEFLCSDNSSYITGQCINLNGGMYFS
jgi:NAD(P)-dependent dehydrogenase (short-subunit alcohol dehydrogenase family)